jgi:hypothetical protein
VEITKTVTSRVQSIGHPQRYRDAEYVQGLRLAIEAAVDYTLEAAMAGDEPAWGALAPILSQARLAARRQVPLEIVLRRYLAGHAVVADLVVEEAGRSRISPEILRSALRDQAAGTDRAVASISEAYGEEARRARPLSTRLRQVRLVRQLLDGELVDPTNLNYQLERWHLGLVARGPIEPDAIATATARFDASRLMLRDDDDGDLWVWLGSRQRLDPEHLSTALSGTLPRAVRTGVGEPGQGREGWRLTHHQARAAVSVAARQVERSARYADVALLASAMQDDLLISSLNSLYLEPLNEVHDGQGVLTETLRAYLAAEGNVSSAAAALGVSRNTVTNRLRSIEAKIGHLRPSRATAVTLAIDLRELAGT